MAEKERYSPTRSGYEAWLWNGNKGTFEDFLELWGKATREDLIADIYELIQELSSEQIREVFDYIETNYF